MSIRLERVLIIPLLLGLFASCETKATKTSAYERPDDIVTFEAPQEGKQIVRITTAMNVNWDAFVGTLSRQFPDKQFIIDYYATAGNNPSMETIRKIIKSNRYDLVVGPYANATALGEDISGEPFLDNYLQNTLDTLEVGGHIYGIPLPISATSIYYDKDLFQKNGWEVPTSVDDFITLCKTIQAKGITPFSVCMKYPQQTVRLLEGMLYDQLFRSVQGKSWYDRLIQGNGSFAGYAEPLFETAKRLFDTNVLQKDFFTASLTTMRKDFFTGKTAMVFYTSDIMTLAESEGCGFTPKMMPFPSTTGKRCSVLYNPSAVMFIPSGIKDDAKRYAFDTSVLAFLSTAEGQDAFLSFWNGVVSLKGYKGVNALYEEMAGYIENGDFHACLSFAPEVGDERTFQTLINNAIQNIGEGTDVDETIAELDKEYKNLISKGVQEPHYETIAHATDDYTVLETSYYFADKIREATHADVALVPNGGFYRSNLACIFKGDVTDDLRIFYQKSIGGKDYITTYAVTGANLKKLLEHPINDAVEQDQFIAASGLSVEYAPWHLRGNRLVKATMEDGTAIDDTKLYTVAAYQGAIDKRYISSTQTTFKELGDPQTFIGQALRSDGTISIDISKRVKLDWDRQKKE